MVFACQKNKFWLEHFANLFCSVDMIPLGNMNLAQKMNALTRLVLAIFVVLLFLDAKWAPLFLLVSLLFIIILYYIQKTQMTEHYTEPASQLSPAELASRLEPRLGRVNSMLNPISANRFCHDKIPLDANPGLVQRNQKGLNPGGVFNNPDFMSKNQRLVGGPNPKTLIAPVIAPPAADLDYWRANNLVTHSAVNAQLQVPGFQSGYQVSSCCPDTVQDRILVPLHPDQTSGIVEAYHEPVTTPTNTVPNPQITGTQEPTSTKNKEKYTELEFPHFTTPEGVDVSVLPVKFVLCAPI